MEAADRVDAADAVESPLTDSEDMSLDAPLRVDMSIPRPLERSPGAPGGGKQRTGQIYLYFVVMSSLIDDLPGISEA